MPPPPFTAQRRWLRTGVRVALCGPAMACGVPPTPPLEDATGDVERWLGGCRQYPLAQQDWCVIQELAGMPDPTVLTPAERTDTCTRLNDPDAVDTCLEQSVRFDERVDVAVCETVRGVRLRASCTLAAADRVLRSEGRLEAAIEACRGTGVLRQHCVSHIVHTRSDAWVDEGYAVAMESVGLVISSTHGVDSMDSLGQQVGLLAARLGAPMDEGPCEYFRDGIAYASCRTRQYDTLSHAGGNTTP